MLQKFHALFRSINICQRLGRGGRMGRSCNVLSETLLAKALLSSAHFPWKATNGTKTLGLLLTLWFDDAETHWDPRLHPYVTRCIRSTLLMWPEYTLFPALMVYISKLIFFPFVMFDLTAKASRWAALVYFYSDPINQPARCFCLCVCVFFFCRFNSVHFKPSLSS